MPETRVAMFNTDEAKTKCNLLAIVHVRPLLEIWIVKYVGKVTLQCRKYFQLKLKHKETGMDLEINLEDDDL